MSGLPLWDSCLLFTCQLWWLLVQAAPAQPEALDPVLLTSIAPGPTEPWPLNQQTPLMNSFMAEDFESFLLNSESSALPAEGPEETEAIPTAQESPAHQPEDPEAGEHSSTQKGTSAQSAVSPELEQFVQVFDGLFDQHPTSSEDVDFSGKEKSSAVRQLPIASVEPPLVQPKGPALPPKSSINREVTVSPLDSGEAQHPVVPYLNITIGAVGVVITPKYPTRSEPPDPEKEASAEESAKMVKFPIQLGVPPKAPERTELSSFQQKTLAQPVSEGDAIFLQRTLAPPQPPEHNYPHPVPIHNEEPTYTDVTVSPLNPELTTTPGPTAEAKNSTALTHIAVPSVHPEVTFPHPETGQAQQSSLTEVTVPPLDLELTITPEPTMEAEHHTIQKKTTAPPMHLPLTFPYAEPVQAQQPTFSDVTVPPLELERTITPEPTMEAEHHTILKKTTAPPMHLPLTFPYAEPVQAQQPTFSDVTVPPLDLELTTTPEPTMEAEHPTTLKKTTTPPMHLQLTFPYAEPVQAQQPTVSDVTVPPLDLERTITPEPTMEAKHHTVLKKTTVPPMHLPLTFPYPEPVQAQQPTFSDVTVPPLDLELTITPEPTMEAEHHTILKKTTAPPMHLPLTFPYSEPVQAQQPTFSDVTVPPLDLELTITPEPTMEAKHHTILKKTTAPPMHLPLTFPYPEPVQAQQPTFSDVTVPPLDLELTITPEPTMEAKHHTILKKTTAPPMHLPLTFPYPEPVQAQQPTFSDVTVPPLDLELTITPEPTPLWQTAAPPRHPQVTVPQTEPVQAQPHIFSDFRFPPVVLELTIRREAAEEAHHHTTLQRTTPPPKQAEVTFPHPEPGHAQQTTFSDVRVAPLNPDLKVTPEPTVEAEHARALQQTTAPPKHPVVASLVQEQQPTLTEVTGHGAELEVIRTQQPGTPESGAPGNEQSAIMSICKLCTCKNETLSCTGLGPKQRLHRVPVLDPKTHNGSFTILNFKGNSISYIDRDTWESYRWVEKLILSENNLRELDKDSFEGLLSLQYLDLSSNKIQLIERNTFEPMPFLQHINLHNNLITNVRFGTFQAWHGMQFLHRLILSHNPLTTVEDLYLFKLPALRYLDIGTTQVSLTTVESILLMALKLRKLILPSHLACCLCQFKSSIEAVSKTVRLHCDSDCPTNTQCDEELYLGHAEGSLMKVLQGREKHNSPELTIEPERASPGEDKGGGLSAFMSLLMKLLTEQEEVKVSKADWDVDHWGDERTEAQGEEEEQESREFRAQVPGYEYKNKLILAAPVIAVATFFMLIFCLMAICQRRTAEEGKEGRGFFSILGHKGLSSEHEMEEGSFQRRWPFWLWDMYWPLNATRKGNVGQNLHHSMSDEGDLEKMEKGETSTSTTKAGTSDSAAEETAEESDA